MLGGKIKKMGFLDFGLKDFIGIGSSLLGAKESDKSAQSINDQNIAMQREFAQNGIRWKVQDAIAAGLHPLAALGAQTSSFSPVAVQGADYQQLGQNMSRAISTTMTKEQKDMSKVSLAIEKEKLKNYELQNLGLLKQLNEQKSVPPRQSINTPPSIFGGGEVNVVPSQQVSSKQMGVEAGIHSFSKDFIDTKGNLWRLPPQDVQEAISELLPEQVRYTAQSINRQIKSAFAKYYVGRKRFEDELVKERPKAPLGYEFRWDFESGQWKLSKLGHHERSRVFYQSPVSHYYRGR